MQNLMKYSNKFFTIILSLTWICFVFYVYITRNIALSPKISQYIFLIAYIFVLRAFGERIFEMLSVQSRRYPSIPKIILDLAIGIGTFSFIIYSLSIIIANVSLAVLISFIILILFSFSNVNKTFLRLIIIDARINLLELKKRELFLFSALVLLFLSCIVLAHTPTIDSNILQGELSIAKQYLLTDTIVFDKIVPPLSISFYLPFLYFFPDQTICISIFNSLLLLFIAIMFYHIVYNQGAKSRIKSLFGAIIILSAPMIMHLGTIPGSRPINLLYFISAIYIIQKLQYNWDKKAQYITGYFIFFITASLGLGFIYSFLIILYLILSKLQNSKVIIFFVSSIALYLTIILRFTVLTQHISRYAFRVLDFDSFFSLLIFPIEISLFNKITANYLPIGPILLILLPFVVFYYIGYLKRPKVIIFILLFLFISIFIKFNFKDFLPVYLYISLFATEALFRLYKKSRLASFFLIIFILSVSIINMLNIQQYHIEEYDPVNVIFGLQTFEEYLSNNLEDYSRIREIEKNLGNNDLLIINNDFNHFYFNIPYLHFDLKSSELNKILSRLSRKYNIYFLNRKGDNIPVETELIIQMEEIELLRYVKSMTGVLND